MSKIWIFFLFPEIILSFQICVEGQNFCSKCNPISKLCIKCEKEIYTPDYLGGCEFARKCYIGKNHCISCNEKGDLCEICEEGYFPDKNGACSYTDNCEISYQGYCLQCIDNFVLVGKNLSEVIKICKSLNSVDLRNCEKINTETGTCEGCQEGYYLTQTDKRCTQTKDCSESKLGLCVKCKYGYYADNKDNKCKLQEGKLDNCQYTNDGITCAQCLENFFFNSEKECLRVKYCEKVNSNYKCLYCTEGYYLLDYENVCTPEINCKNGNRDFGICTECIDGYYIDYKDFKCKSNQEDNEFQYCIIANGDKCTKCSEYYILGKDSRCSSTTNCAESRNGICEKCIENFYLGYDHKCNSAEYCIYSNYNYECIECEGNYFVDKNTNKCVVAEGDFEHCKFGYKGWLCLECKDDYYLNLTNHTCFSNLEDNDFYKCTITDDSGKHCKGCTKGYYLGQKDLKCTNIEGCALSESRVRCKECYDFYYLNVLTGKCHYNDEINNEDEKKFYRCNRTNEEGTACEICKNGLVLNEDKLCIDKQHCSEIKDKKCQRCQSDYCLNNIFGCIEVIYEFNYCKECNDIFNFENCTQCIEGYEIDEYGDCVEIEEEKEEEEDDDYDWGDDDEDEIFDDEN